MATPPWLDRRAYPFTSRFVELSAGRMHYVDEGRGETVLFVHGTPTWSFEFRHLISALSPSVRCVATDHLGFGLSDRPMRFAYTPEAHASTLAEFIDRLGLDRITLVVHDFGGPIGLPLALADRSRVSRVVLINTWGWPFDDDARMQRRAAVAGGALGRWLYKYLNASLRLIMPSAYGDKRKLSRQIHRQYLGVFRDPDARVRVLHALARALTRSREHYATILAGMSRLQQMPALIVWGLADSAFGPSQLERWRQLLPHARVVTIPGAGHWPHEEEPETVVEALRLFLESQVPDPILRHRQRGHPSALAMERDEAKAPGVEPIA
jgi:haloalkane dehalogenase